MRSLMLGLCGSLPLMVGATDFTVQNADLVYVSGPGPVEVVNATEVYANVSENGSPWSGLYSRNEGQQDIVLQAEVGGQYQLKVWSIPADPMNPQRVENDTTVLIDAEGIGPFDVPDLLTLLAAWGSCSDACVYDLDQNGVIDATDMLILLDNWIEIE